MSLEHKPWPSYLQIGDIVQMDKNGNGDWDHSMMITRVSGDDLIVSYHTPNTREESLKAFKSRYESKYPGTKFMGWRIKDNY